MMNIIIPADFTNNFYNSLNMALLFEQFSPLEVNVVFENKAKEADVQLKFGEIINNYLPCFVNETSNIKYTILPSKLEKEIENIRNPEIENLFFLTHHEIVEGSKKSYSTENTLKQVKSLKFNTIALPSDNIPGGIKRILFPVHLLSKVRHKVTLTVKLARLFNAQVLILNTLTTKQPAMVKRCSLYAHQVNRHFLNMGIPTSLESIEATNAVDAIIEYANENQADLISVIPEENPGGLFSKGYIAEVIEKSNIPLLVITSRKLRLPESAHHSNGE